MKKVGVLEVALQGARANEERTVVNKRIRDHGAFPLSVDEYDKIVKMKKKTINYINVKPQRTVR